MRKVLLGLGLLNLVVGGSYWQPSGELTWDYHLLTVPKNYSESIAVYDIDVLDSSADIIDDLHNVGKKVICYFSAGSYEDWRNDANQFNEDDLGETLDGWPGERWLNVSSTNVRKIMVDRIKQAKSKNCDAIDPDNIDGYDNDTGFNLTEADAIDFVKFLAKTGHDLGMAVGLKNGGAIVEQLADDVDFSVQEQCVKYNECDLYHDILMQGKPIFHIEYPKNDESNFNDISESQMNKYCHSNLADGFSSIIKNINLDSWLVDCQTNATVLSTSSISGNSTSSVSSNLSTNSTSTISEPSNGSNDSISSNEGSSASQNFGASNSNNQNVKLSFLAVLLGYIIY